MNVPYRVLCFGILLFAFSRCVGGRRALSLVSGGARAVEGVELERWRAAARAAAVHMRMAMGRTRRTGNPQIFVTLMFERVVVSCTSGVGGSWEPLRTILGTHESRHEFAYALRQRGQGHVDVQLLTPHSLLS